MKILFCGDFAFSGNTVFTVSSELKSYFLKQDFRILNYEAPIIDVNYIKPLIKVGPHVCNSSKGLNVLKELGIDATALANNHITDAGANGVVDTMKVLDGAGIRYLGAGENSDSISHYLFFDVCEKRICLYNVAETMYNEPTENQPGVFLYDEYVVCKEIDFLRNQCDFLIVVYHGGAEKFRYPSPQTRRRFHRMVDNGANLVLSQHTHCVGSEEYYKPKIPSGL